MPIGGRISNKCINIMKHKVSISIYLSQYTDKLDLIIQLVLSTLTIINILTLYFVEDLERGV